MVHRRREKAQKHRGTRKERHSHPKVRITQSTGRPEKTLPKGDMRPFRLMTVLASRASTLSMAMSSLKEKGMERKKPSKKDSRRKASGEEAHGSAAKTMPARMDAASQMCARERW